MANKRFIVKNGLDNSGDNSVVNTITNVAEPTNNSDAATKYYVDTHSSGGTVTAVTGTLPVESTGGTAPDISLGTASNGQLLIGTGTGFTKSTLTQGTGVTITNASGAITIAATGSGGDVVGPASSTDNAIVRFDLTTGKLIQNSTATLSDGGIMIVTELDTDSIKSATANSPIVIAPDGTGDVHLNTDSVRIGDNNADATIATRGTGDLIITTNEGSVVEGIVRLYDGVNGDITLTPNGSGQVKVGTDQVVTLVASQTLTNKTISGSANTLSNIANASLTNSTISGVALGSNLNALTISSPLTGTSYNGSSAVSIGIPVATTSVNGYLSSTDWTTFNNKGSGSVTSVAATVPSLLSISGSPITTSGTLAITYSGTALPVANGGTGLTTLTAGYIPYGAGTSAFGSSANLFWDSANSYLGIGTAAPYNKVEIEGASARLGLNNGGGASRKALLIEPLGYGGNTYARLESYDYGTSTGGILALNVTGGNVGIGTASPSAKLEVSGTSASGYIVSTITNLSSTGYAQNLMNIGASGANGQSGIFYAPTIFYKIGIVANDTTTPITFVNNNGTERMRISSGGNLLIGATSQAYATSGYMLGVQSGGAQTFISIAKSGQTLDSGGMIIGLDASDSYVWNRVNQPILFGTNNTERMRIDSSGNVGIGTASPTVGLHVVKDQGSGYIAAFRANVSSPYITFQTTSSITQIQGINSAFTATNDIAMQLSGGNVGIGTASPTNKLHIAASGLDISGGIAVDGSTMQGIRLQNTVNTNSSLGIWFGTNNVHWCGISGQRTDYTTTWGTDLRFYTHEDATSNITYARERMRIDSSGNLLVGVTSASYSSANRGVAILGGSASGLLGFQIGGVAKGYVAHFDSSMQIWNEVASPILFGTSATERMRIDSSGNVGIGATTLLNPGTPNEKTLTVSATKYPQIFTIATDATANNRTYRTISRDSGVYQIQLINDAGTSEQTAYEVSRSANSVSYQRWFAGTSEAMRIDSSGNVGIGTATPQAKLSVTGTSGAFNDIGIFQVTSGTGASNNWKLTFGVNDSGYTWIQSVLPGTDLKPLAINPSGGNVGIGTTSPGYKLDVNGTTFTTGITISTGGGTNVANTVNIDTNGSGTARYYSHGSNSSTKGSHEFHLSSSNGSLDVIGMSLDTSGNLTNTGVFKGNSGTKGFGGITTTTSTSTPTGGSSGDHYYIY